MKNRTAASWAAAVLLFTVIAAAWWVVGPRRTPIASGKCRGCNVLLITIDTLRLDRVGAFGGGGLTPNIDRLAGEGMRLTRAYASAPLTLPSHTSILTAAQPPVHGVRTNGLFRLGAGRPTLAGVLKTAGYRTGAFVGAFALDARFGLNQGFDVYDDRYGEQRTGDVTEGAERRAEEVMKPALDWILHPAPGNGHPAPFFAWVHFYDPHEPYRAPEPFASKYAPYDAEVAYTDAILGRLLDALRDAGQLEHTLVVVAADHGEALGEHGERTHGVFVYDVTMKVPWVMWAGDRFRGASDTIVGLVDLAPTILDLLNVPAPREFEGRSVLRRLQEPRSGASAYVEAMDANLTRNWAPLTGIVTDRFKYIDLPIPEVYDLDADPKETTNLYSRESERARSLAAMLRETTTGFLASAAPAEKTTLSAESRQRLQALGYVAASAGPPRRVYGDADDPKTLIGPANELNRALADFRAGSRGNAMASVQAIIDRYPGFSTPYGVFAAMQHDTGDLPGAITTLETLVRKEIADQSVLVVLAGYLMEAGRLEQSSTLLEAVVAAHPDYADAYNSLGAVSSRLGRHDRAQAAFRKVLELDPTSATAYENLGVDELGTGNFDGALTDLQHALALDPNLAVAHNALATLYLKRHDAASAIAHWQKAIDLNPRFYDALFNLGTVLFDSGRKAEARPYLERFVREAPPSRYGPDIAKLRAMLTQ